MLVKLARLAAKHARSSCAELLYLKTGWDWTRPVTISAIVNERCNSRCLHCMCWRLDHYDPEMSIEQWQAILSDLRGFLGRYSVNFSGGEPLLKKGFLKLLAHCRDHGIDGGVTTHGMHLPEFGAELVATRPFNLNISMDGPNAAAHERIRGVKGMFEKIERGIALVRAEQARQRVRFPIVIKPTVMSYNFRLLPEIVEWAQRVGASAVHFQPLERQSPESNGELWIEEKDHAELAQVLETLVSMKRLGAPILNTAAALRLQVASFREDPLPANARPSRIGMRTLIIRPTGDAELCYGHPAVGNLRVTPIREIWRGPAARSLRQDLVHNHHLWLKTTVSEKSLRDRARMGLILLSHRGGAVRSR